MRSTSFHFAIRSDRANDPQFSPLDTRQPALVEEIFSLERSGAIAFPAADVLYRPDGSLVPASANPWPEPAASHMRNARQLEFQQRQYAAAVAEYRRAFAVVSDPALRGDALIAVARVERKEDRRRAALASVARIHVWRKVRLPERPPGRAIRCRFCG